MQACRDSDNTRRDLNKARSQPKQISEARSKPAESENKFLRFGVSPPRAGKGVQGIRAGL